MTCDDSDRDERTIFVGGLPEKMTEALLYELFFQAGKNIKNLFYLFSHSQICFIFLGPIERVAIPKEKDGKIKTFGFVTYKHLSSVGYALNIFFGTKMFGRELFLKNRNGSRTRDQAQPSQHIAQHSSLHGFNNMASHSIQDLSPAVQQQLVQQQLLLLATNQHSIQNYVNAGAQMFTGVPLEPFASERQDAVGSHRDREHYVDRNRYHRDENRTNRSKPYRRSRSRSPPKRRSRDRSPDHRGRGRRSDESRSNYHRWGKH